MTKMYGLLLSTPILVGLVPPKAHAAGLPVVIGATVDYTHNTLTITGRNFGSSPTVTLDSITFLDSLVLAPGIVPGQTARVLGLQIIFATSFGSKAAAANIPPIIAPVIPALPTSCPVR